MRNNVFYLVVVTLNALEKERGPVLGGLGEDLQQVAVLVKVNQNSQLLQLSVKYYNCGYIPCIPGKQHT